MNEGKRVNSSIDSLSSFFCYILSLANECESNPISQSRNSTLTPFLLLLSLCLHWNPVQDTDSFFSGPQVGESLPEFSVDLVLGKDAGKKVDLVKEADGKPIVLIFVHDSNRQSISMTRILSGYTVSRSKEGLSTGIIFLDDDAASLEANVKRMRHALTQDAPTGISLEGKEGPGSYGLNRKATLTILIGKEGKVVGNFALIQPSLQVDLPKILKSICEVIGGEPPKLSELPGMPKMENNLKEVMNLRPLLAPVIKLDATPEEVDEAAAKVEKLAAENEEARKEIHLIATIIIKSGKLSDYGTAKAQEYLQKWAKEFGPVDNSQAPSKPQR